MNDPYEPRKFFAPEGYANSGMIARFIDRTINPTWGTTEMDRRGGVSLAIGAVSCGVQAYHLEEDIGGALKRTDMPSDMLFRDLRLPHPAFVICPRSGTVPLDEKRSLEILVVGIVSDPGIVVSPMFCIMGWARGGSETFSEPNPGRRMWATIPMDSPMSGINEPPEFLIGSDLSDDSERSRKDALRIAVGACMLITNYRELITDGPVLKRIKSRDGGKVDLFAPRWIGKATGPRHASMPGPGTHASPSAHWRRGHWRRQRIGEGRKDNRMTWIRPSFVNPEGKLTEGAACPG